MDNRNIGKSAARRRGSLIETEDGTSLFARDWGAGPPVVFLSGWALSSDAWGYQMAPLSESGLRCVAYDRRGHGRSSDPGRGYDYDTLADDLATVLDTLELERVTLVAHSMAGGEAIRYLSRHGAARIARLVLVGASTPFPRKADDNPDGVDPAVFEHFRSQLLLRDYPKWLQDNARPFVMPETSPEMIDWIKGMMLQCSMQAAAECNRAMETTDFRAELRTVALPTLIVHGDRDVSAPLDLCGCATAALLPRARLEVYVGAPHGLFLTHIDRFNRDLLAFVEKSQS